MNKIISILLMCNGMMFSSLIQAEPTSNWTLNSSILHTLKVAPEIKTADAEIGKQKGKLKQAVAWPNPSISIQVDNSLGFEDAAGGYDVTQFSISQPLVFGRIKHQRIQAEADITNAQSKRSYQQLSLEYAVAQRFHLLQLTHAKLKLAQKRLKQARRYQSSSNNRSKNDVLIRYLTPLETMRLDIVMQAAKQTVEVSEGEFNEAATSFKALLGLSIDTKLKLKSLSPVPAPDKFNILEENLQKHPSLEADKNTISSTLAGIAVAKSTRTVDPTLTLFRAEEFLGNRRQDTTGIILNIQIPL